MITDHLPPPLTYSITIVASSSWTEGMQQASVFLPLATERSSGTGHCRRKSVFLPIVFSCASVRREDVVNCQAVIELKDVAGGCQEPACHLASLLSGAFSTLMPGTGLVERIGFIKGLQKSMQF